MLPSQESTAPFSRSQIAAEAANKPSTMQLESSSSYSAEKDQLLDQYQAKMGELLGCQAELNAVKSQLRSQVEVAQRLKEQWQLNARNFEERLDSANNRIRELESSNNSQLHKSVMQNDTIDNLQTKLRHLESAIALKDKELGESKSQIRDQDENFEQLQQEHEFRVKKLKDDIAQRDANINQLKLDALRLIEQNSSSDETIVQQKQSLEEQFGTNKALVEENNRLKSATKRLKLKIKNYGEKSL
jgi:chromosome segregation ATPase